MCEIVVKGPFCDPIVACFFMRPFSRYRMLKDKTGKQNEIRQKNKSKD